MNKQKSQSGNIHVIVIVVLVVALIGSLGFIFWHNFVQKNTDDTIKNSPTSSSTTDKYTDSHGSWKTYSNSGLGFSFRYPSDWTISDNLGESSVEIARLVSPDIATETKGMVDAPKYDISLSAQKKHGSTNFTSGSIIALISHEGVTDTSDIITKKNFETINSIFFSEFDMIANPPYFTAVFTVGDSYVAVDFLTTPTKADLSATSSKILTSFKLN